MFHCQELSTFRLNEKSKKRRTVTFELVTLNLHLHFAFSWPTYQLCGEIVCNTEENARSTCFVMNSMASSVGNIPMGKVSEENWRFYSYLLV